MRFEKVVIFEKIIVEYQFFLLLDGWVSYWEDKLKV